MKPLEIAPLETWELGAAAALHALCFPDEPWSEESLRSLHAAPGVAGWSIFPAGQRPHLVGFVLARLLFDEAEILTLCVAPDHRRRGVAGELLAATLQGLAALGGKRLFLEVAEDNRPALRLYRNFGFSQIGLRPAYYRRLQGKAVSAFLMARDLF
ncbi:MAG TPA: GNAT family N-acetyltransferase [Kiloniellales bacterium]|nr:GNAT family N-acetyltransferase [Kiloniellales bacterium]